MKTRNQQAPAMPRYWSAEEDAVIREVVNDCRRDNPKAQVQWHVIESRLSGRSTHEIRLRWRRMLDAEFRIRHGAQPRQKCLRCGAFKRGHSCPYVSAPPEKPVAEKAAPDGLRLHTAVRWQESTPDAIDYEVGTWYEVLGRA